MDEHVNASYSKNNEENLQQNKDVQKESYNRNYCRNKDAYTKAKAAGRVEEMDGHDWEYNDENELNFQVEVKNRKSEFVKKLLKKV
jgi:hypothetical protein